MNETQHNFEVGDQVDGGIIGSDDYELGTVAALDPDGEHVVIRWASNHSTTMHWDDDDLQHVPGCARCGRVRYCMQGNLVTCSHCQLIRGQA